MDEASAALSVESEATLYEDCGKKNTQLISIGHKPTYTKTIPSANPACWTRQWFMEARG